MVKVVNAENYIHVTILLGFITELERDDYSSSYPSWAKAAV